MSAPLKQKLISPVLMWSIIITGIFLFMWLLPHVWLFRRNIFTSLLLIPAALNWLYFFFGAVRVHRRAPQSAAAINHVVTTGVYAMVRHPIYSADILLAWGVFFFLPTLSILCSAAWLTVVMVAWMNLEEHALEEKFGDEYTCYKNRTPMFIPNYRARTQP
ncbi:MAG: isoprenylcysteine carboxylmethyltransferase family protein [Armatimonadota bacterium]|nr:isoprenylcysteine carboxylmethyltransferase family protein [bacterium]